MWLHDSEFSSRRYATSISYTSIQMLLKYSLNPCLNGLEELTSPLPLRQCSSSSDSPLALGTFAALDGADSDKLAVSVCRPTSNCRFFGGILVRPRVFTYRVQYGAALVYRYD